MLVAEPLPLGEFPFELSLRAARPSRSEESEREENDDREREKDDNGGDDNAAAVYSGEPGPTT